ncbi:hypothetical protein [Polaribacter septentrionalilitoris]|uniref:hypothetical protein n=1 Tax=Polaribacter septentrionalilitoris TaxID=2494657 RepID=UPI00135B1C38|nr:hypothetical protein [Polaribacter septentrionalilitoris]
MLGILLLFFIGKYFYKLAEKFKKSQWGYAILGVVTYYGGTIIFGLAFGIISEVISPGYIETVNETMLGIAGLPFGVLATYILYKYLAKTWKNNLEQAKVSIDDIGKIEE